MVGCAPSTGGCRVTPSTASCPPVAPDVDMPPPRQSRHSYTNYTETTCPHHVREQCDLALGVHRTTTGPGQHGHILQVQPEYMDVPRGVRGVRLETDESAVGRIVPCGGLRWKLAKARSDGPYGTRQTRATTAKHCPPSLELKQRGVSSSALGGDTKNCARRVQAALSKNCHE